MRVRIQPGHQLVQMRRSTLANPEFSLVPADPELLELRIVQERPVERRHRPALRTLPDHRLFVVPSADHDLVRLESGIVFEFRQGDVGVVSRPNGECDVRHLLHVDPEIVQVDVAKFLLGVDLDDVTD